MVLGSVFGELHPDEIKTSDKDLTPSTCGKGAQLQGRDDLTRGVRRQNTFY